MSDNSKIECAVCGKPGIPPSDCPTCFGRANTQPFNYSLSELRSMSHEERQRVTQGDRPSGAAPKIVNLPGTQSPN